jgi:hypothetical protein
MQRLGQVSGSEKHLGMQIAFTFRQPALDGHGKNVAMTVWTSMFMHDPLVPLCSSGNEAISYFVERDLLDRDVDPIATVWDLPEVKKIVRKQRADGSWKPAASKGDAVWKYNLTETWRQLRFLVDQYAMNRSHPAVANACAFVLSCQSEEGDIRGILANQYAPYYTGALLALLIKAGFATDPRVEKGMRWLLSMRQDDGGWVIGSPGMMGYAWKDVCALTSRWTSKPEQCFDRTKPFSAAGTGMVLRAFAYHPDHRHSKAAMDAATLLKSKFFKKDNWSWYQHPDNWIRFQFPYWWNHLLSALDICSLIGIPKEDEDIARALQWFVVHQQQSGLWKESYSKIHKCNENKRSKATQGWITLSICRVLKRYWG